MKPWRVLIVLILALALPAAAADKRVMTFMDVLGMRSAGSPAWSPDGKWLLHTLSVPDWKAAKSFTDLYLVPVEKGAVFARQLTFTKDKNEASPAWARDGSFFVFLSNRDGAQNQLYLMRPDGGEARRLTDTKDGVAAFAFSRDKKWLAYSTGRDEARQVWALSVAGVETTAPVQLTKHATGVDDWQFSPDGRRIYFLASESADRENRERRDKGFTVRIRNEETPLTHLWSLDVESTQETRLTSGADYSVGDLTLSDDGRWLGFRGTTADRYARTVTDRRS